MICETPSYKEQVQDSLSHCVTYNNTSPRTLPGIFQFNLVQLLNHIRLFVTSWTAAHQDSLSVSNSRSLLKLTSIASMMPSNHPTLRRPPLLYY